MIAMTSGAAEPLPAAAQRELLAALSRQARRVCVPVLLAALFIASLIHGHAPDHLLLLWLGLVAVVQVGRIPLLQRLSAHTGAHPWAGLRIATLISLGNGIAVASCLLFFDALPDLHRTMISMVLIGLATGTCATSLGHPSILLAYIGPLLGALAAAWITSPLDGAPAWARFMLVPLIAFLFMILLGLARDSHAAFRADVVGRQRLAELNGQLQGALADAQAANGAKTRFLASASHDLRQPLNTLQVFCAALALRELDPKSRQIASKIDDAMQDLASELDALLDVSRLDAGVVPVARTRVEAGQLLARLADSMQPLAEQKGLALRVEAAPALWLETDRMQLDRALRNLIDNAIKYTPQGEVTLSACRSEGDCLVSVADTGPGIAPHQQAMVFEEFYQIDNQERDRRKGLGLGLSIVRRLVGLLGGRLDLRSAPGHGSVFMIRLPLAAPGVAGIPRTPGCRRC